MKRTLLLAALAVLVAGCSDKQGYTAQEMTCIEWGGFASHQYSRYLEGELQEGDLSRWANAQLNRESAVNMSVVEAAIPLVFRESKFSHDTAVWFMGDSIRKVCTQQQWAPMANRKDA